MSDKPQVNARIKILERLARSAEVAAKHAVDPELQEKLTKLAEEHTAKIHTLQAPTIQPEIQTDNVPADEWSY